MIAVTKNNIDAKFKLIHAKLEKVEKNIDRKFGFSFLSFHVFSQDSLRESLESGKVNAAAKLVYDTIEGWNRAGDLSVKLRHYYNFKKKPAVLNRIDHLKLKIEKREPTMLDKLLSTVDHFKENVGKRLMNIGFAALPVLRQLSDLLGRFHRDRLLEHEKSS